MEYGDSLYLSDNSHRHLEQIAINSPEGINEINSKEHYDFLGQTKNRKIIVLHEDSTWDWKDSALIFGGILTSYAILGYMVYLNLTDK